MEDQPAGPCQDGRTEDDPAGLDVRPLAGREVERVVKLMWM